MESNQPVSCPPAEVKEPTMFRSRLSHPVEKEQRQTDSFLTAARLLRGGWSNEEQNTRSKDSALSISNHQRPFLKVDIVQGPRKTEVKTEEHTANRPVSTVDIRKLTKNDQTKTGSSEDTAKLTSVLSAEEQAASKTGLYSQKSVVCVRMYSCRSACRRSRKFKPSGLPVITEM